jgi:hypothetical protein
MGMAARQQGRSARRPSLCGSWPHAVALGVLALLVASQPAIATDDDAVGAAPEYGIRPALWADTELPDGHFTYALEPGTEIEDGIEILNFTAEPLTFDVYGADLRTARDGGFAPAPRGAAAEVSGDWIVPAVPSIEVAPNRSATVAFTVSIPIGTAPGDHPGAIVVERQTEPADGAGITFQPRLAQRVLINVPGEVDLGVELGALTAVHEDGQVRFELPVRNTGNVTFTTSGTVEIEVWGRERSLSLSPDGVYAVPGGEATLTSVWVDPPFLGRATANAELDVTVGNDAPVRATSTSITVWLVPWTALLLALALLLLLLGLGIADGPRRRLRTWNDHRREDRALLHHHRADRRAREAASRRAPPVGEYRPRRTAGSGRQ